MEDWTVVYTAAFPVDAGIVRSLLESGGITVFLKDELSAQVFGVSAPLGGIKVLVHPLDTPLAAEMLARGGYNGPDSPGEEDGNAEQTEE